MGNPLNLIPGKKYRIITGFKDYDKIPHPIGEEWTFVTTNFIPYDDGLTLHVIKDGFLKEISYRFQWRAEEQAEIINHFHEFVEPI